MAIVERIQTKDKTRGKLYELACLKCVGRTKHQSISSVELYERDDHPPFACAGMFQLIQCQGCGHISFREGFSEAEGFSQKNWSAEGDDFTVRIYPPRIAGRRKLERAFLMPNIIGKVYEETQTALCNEQPILAAAGIRILVECLCKEKSAQGRNLEHKIDHLVGLGILTQAGAEILHGLRILGNESVHEIRRHEDETLHTAMDIVESVLTNVYILPRMADELARRGGK